MSDIYYAVADRPKSAMEAFQKRYEIVSENKIRDVFSLYGYNLVSLERSKSWGTSHVVYYAQVEGRPQRLVFRSNAGKIGGFETPELAMLSEKIVTDSVRALGVKTNTILHVDVSRSVVDFDYQIQEELCGEDPERYVDAQGRFLGSQEDYDGLSFELGQSIARYSQLTFDGFGRIDEGQLLIPTEKHNGKINNELFGTKDSFFEYITTNLVEHLMPLFQAGLLDKTTFQDIIRIFEEHKDCINNTPASLVHHDLADHNIMYDSKQKGLAGVFDWEAMVFGDPLLDLGSCPTWTTHYPRKQKLIEGYASIGNLPDDADVRMNLYELRTWIWKAKFALDMGWKDLAKTWAHNIQTLLQRF